MVSLRRTTYVWPLNHHCQGQSSSSPSRQALLAYFQRRRVYSGHQKIISGPASIIRRKRTVRALRQDAPISSRWTCSAQSIQHSHSFFICPLVQRWESIRKDQDASPRENPPTNEEWDRRVVLCLAPTVCTWENGIPIPFPVVLDRDHHRE